jgi:hypothetical protein
MDAAATVLQGTLDLLILKAASLQPMHGWGISEACPRIAAARASIASRRPGGDNSHKRPRLGGDSAPR